MDTNKIRKTEAIGIVIIIMISHIIINLPQKGWTEKNFGKTLVF